MKVSEPASGQRTGGLFAVLSNARFYDAFQNALGARALRVELARQYVRDPRVARPRVLDVGCGTAAILDHLGDCEYVGIDLSARYVDAARRRHGMRGRFACADVSDPASLPSGGPFDVVLLQGFLHHLPDARASALLGTVSGLLLPEGRLIALEATFSPDSHPLGRLLVDLDRGRHVRSPEGYRCLAEAHFQHVEVHVRHDLLRVPYSHAILECTTPPGHRASAARVRSGR
jgi:SAM-dependent methyltransferase